MDHQATCVVAAAALSEQVYYHDRFACGSRLELELELGGELQQPGASPRRQQQVKALCIDRVLGVQGRVQYGLFYVPELHAAFAVWAGARTWRDYARCISSAPAAVAVLGAAAAPGAGGSLYDASQCLTL